MHSNMKRLYLKRALLKKYPRPPKRLKKILYPDRIEQRYLNQLRDIVAFTHERINARIIPLLPKLEKYFGRARKDADDDSADLGDLADQLEKVRLEVTEAFSAEDLKRLAEMTGRSVEEWNAKQLNGSIGSVAEIDLFSKDAALAKEMGAFVVQNVSLIQSIPDEYLSQVEKVVASSARGGIRVEEIAQELSDRFEVSDSRAELIARDQIGKFNGQLTEVRQKDLGIDRYVWRDSGDARVRDSHRENSKRDVGFGPGVYAWDDPPETGHPGEDFQCRCWAEPVLDQFFEEG